MPSSASDTRKERVNLLLPSPFDAPGLREALASDDRAERRLAIAEIEGHEGMSAAANAGVVREIFARLSGSAVASLTADASEAGSAYLSIDELDPHIGPPESVGISNPYTGVVTVEGPEGASPEEAVQSVHEKVSDLAPQAELTVPHRVSAAMDRTLEVEPELVDPPSAASRVAWLEAALAGGLAPETVPWGVTQVRAPNVWALGVSGQGVTVAVVDTGIAPHLDLARPVRGFTFIPGSNSYYDDHGHGTHVAGTIAALRGNGRGVVGVAPLVQLIAVKVLARDDFSRGDSVALGITWAANNGAQVINLSLGSRAPSESVNRAVLYAQSRRVVVCAAAGNDYGRSVSYPAAFRDICIAVAATDRGNRRAAFSNIGAELDLSAPGVEILSAALGNGYRELQGTSMATPHVSGVAALVLSKYPALPPSGVKQQLERTAIQLGTANEYGRGLVQADRAVVMPPQPPVASATEGGYSPPAPATPEAGGGAALAADVSGAAAGSVRRTRTRVASKERR